MNGALFSVDNAPLAASSPSHLPLSGPTDVSGARGRGGGVREAAAAGMCVKRNSEGRNPGSCQYGAHPQQEEGRGGHH